jgi:hypothetical protein
MNGQLGPLTSSGVTERATSFSNADESFGGRLRGPAALGRRRPLMGEPDEARVQNGS